MEHETFDELTRQLKQGMGTRRGVVRLLAGSVLATAGIHLGLASGASVSAKRKKKRSTGRCRGAFPVNCPAPAGDPLGRCYPRGAICCSRTYGGGACPSGQTCCPPSLVHPEGNCATPTDRCCPASAGGGSCPDFAPVCCAPTLQDPFGLCIPSGFKCCTSAQGGGYCREDQTCCPPSPGFPEGTCADPRVPCPPTQGVATDSEQLEPRQMQRPRGSVDRGGQPRSH